MSIRRRVRSDAPSARLPGAARRPRPRGRRPSRPTPRVRADHGRDWWPITIPDVARVDVPQLAGRRGAPDIDQRRAPSRCCIASKHRVRSRPRAVVRASSAAPSRPEGGIALDLTGLDRVLDVDEVSGTVSVEAGVFGPDLERAVTNAGWTVGTSPSPSISPPSVDGSPVAGPASTPIATARSRTSCAVSASCSPTARWSNSADAHRARPSDPT